MMIPKILKSRKKYSFKINSKKRLRRKSSAVGLMLRLSSLMRTYNSQLEPYRRRRRDKMHNLGYVKRCLTRSFYHLLGRSKVSSSTTWSLGTSTCMRRCNMPTRIEIRSKALRVMSKLMGGLKVSHLILRSLSRRCLPSNLGLISRTTWWDQVEDHHLVEPTKCGREPAVKWWEPLLPWLLAPPPVLHLPSWVSLRNKKKLFRMSKI